MRFLRQLHLYLGCLFAPLLIFFAITGAWQLFDWHESTKDRRYLAPAAVAMLSAVHKHAHLPPTPGRQATPLRYFMAAAAVGLVLSSVLGVIMAYRFSRKPLAASFCLFAGILIPAALLWIYR